MSMDSGTIPTGGQALALLLTGCVTLRKSLSLSKAEFLTYKMVIITEQHYNDDVKIKCKWVEYLIQHLAYCKYSVNISYLSYYYVL